MAGWSRHESRTSIIINSIWQRKSKDEKIKVMVINYSGYFNPDLNGGTITTLGLGGYRFYSNPVATPAKTRSTSPEHAKPSSPATQSSKSATPAPARQVKSEYHAPTKSQTRKTQQFSQTRTIAEPTTNTAKVIQQLAHKPQLKSTEATSTNTTPPANAFNSSIAHSPIPRRQPLIIAIKESKYTLKILKLTN